MPPIHPSSLVEAFERDLREHADAMYSLVRGLARREQGVADVLQEASLRAWKAYGHLDHRQNLRSWFLRIAYTTFIDAVRSDRRGGYEHVEFDGDLHDPTVIESKPWEPELIRNSMNDQIVGALESLPAEWQATVRLVDIEGMEYEEAARVLGVAVGTVRSRLHRARKRMYDQLATGKTASQRALEQNGSN